MIFKVLPSGKFEKDIIMDESKLTKEQIAKIQAKLDRAEKSGLAKRQTKEEMLLEFKKRLGLV